MGQRPLFVFTGVLFENDPEYQMIKSLFLDFFRGEPISEVSVHGLEHVVSLTVETRGTVHLRVYAIQLKKSATKVPYVELAPMGPHMNLKVDRIRMADSEIMRQAIKVPREIRPKKVKNVTRDDVGDKFGRVHLEKQDFTKLQIRKMKGLKQGPKEWKVEAAVEE